MIDGTDQPEIPLNFAKRAMRYKEFAYNINKKYTQTKDNKTKQYSPKQPAY